MSITVAESLADYETDQIAAGRSACTLKLRLSYLRRWSATLDDPYVPTLTSIKTFSGVAGMGAADPHLRRRGAPVVAAVGAPIPPVR